MASQMRSKEALPQLIRYLSFKKEQEPEQEGDIAYHRHVEDCEYPAVVALVRTGPAARRALVHVVESESSSALIAQNAAHTIVLSFTQEKVETKGYCFCVTRRNPLASKRSRNSNGLLRSF